MRRAISTSTWDNAQLKGEMLTWIVCKTIASFFYNLTELLHQIEVAKKTYVSRKSSLNAFPQPCTVAIKNFPIRTN